MRTILILVVLMAVIAAVGFFSVKSEFSGLTYRAEKGFSSAQERWYALKWKNKKVGYIEEDWHTSGTTIVWSQRFKIKGKGRGQMISSATEEQLVFSSKAPFELLSGSVRHNFSGKVTTANFKVRGQKLAILKDGKVSNKNYLETYTFAQHMFPESLGRIKHKKTQYQLKLWDMDTFATVNYKFFGYRHQQNFSSWNSQKREAKWQSRWRYDVNGKLVSRQIKDFMSYQLTSKKVALENNGNDNLLQHEYVKIDKPLGDVSQIATLKLELSGRDKQTSKQNSIGGPLQLGDENMAVAATDFLAATARYPQLPQIKTLVVNILKSKITATEKVKALIDFVAEFVINDDVLSPSSVQSILDDPRGDCTEHALLFVTLARASGIPAREVNGLLYLGDEQQKYQAHVWVEVFINNHWHAVDPTWGKYQLDAGYIQINSKVSSDSSLQTVRLATSGQTFRLKSIHYL